MLRHDLQDILFPVQFPEAVELAHQFGLADWVCEVLLRIALEDEGRERGIVLVDCFIDFAFFGRVQQLSLVGVVLHAYRCILFHHYINANEDAVVKTDQSSLTSPRSSTTTACTNPPSTFNSLSNSLPIFSSVFPAAIPLPFLLQAIFSVHRLIGSIFIFPRHPPWCNLVSRVFYAV